MSRKYITTEYLIETLTNSGYRVTENTDSYGRCIDVFDGLVHVGSVRKDSMYCLKIYVHLKDEYRERLFNVLCDYAKTPIDERKDKIYTLRISGTNLYLTSIDGTEMTVVSDNKGAKQYRQRGVERAKKLARKHNIVIKKEKVNATN